MCNKAPSVVVTDGDDAMIAAVKKVFPEAMPPALWLYTDMEEEGFKAECEEAFIEHGLEGKMWTEQMHSVLGLIQNLELVMREYCNNELWAQLTSLYTEPVLTTGLQAIEKSVAGVYTRAMFMKVKKEVEKVVCVNIVSRMRVSTTMVYTTGEFGI
ncbi:hypothetical protein PIB30_084349 [Stylosanthes scabra]|uniref:Protein FAR1-RELATED SEQUENCE n=1 Tax=Stylosanthes scabra TaxID=79078 RepID=A0ABU6VSD0_9FABA|nr:hypothetical protein [Stylosanthes scabra]